MSSNGRWFFTLFIAFTGTTVCSTDRAEAQLYKVTDLGAGRAAALNNDGDVIFNDSRGSQWCTTAYLFVDQNGDGAVDAGDIVEIANLPGGDVTCAKDINDAGQIVGVAETSCAPGELCSTKRVGFIRETNGTMTALPAPFGVQGAAYGINNNDPPRIAGMNSAPSVAVVWVEQAGVGTITYPLLPPPSLAVAIDDESRVVGRVFTASNVWHAALWEPATGQGPPWEFTDLGSLGCAHSDCSSEFYCSTCSHSVLRASEARGLNSDDRGEPVIVGQSIAALMYNDTPFRYAPAGSETLEEASPGEMTDLGVLGGANGGGNSINACGQIVGYVWPIAPNHSWHAFVWSGQMLDLNELIDPGLHWTLYEAKDVNDIGQIVGRGKVKGEPYTHAFLLTPSIDVVDPNPLQLDGADVSNDKEILGDHDVHRVKGLAADGVTRILLRLVVGGNGTVSFSIKDELCSGNSAYVGKLGAPRGAAAGSPIDVSSVKLADGRWMAFAVLTAPEDFVRRDSSQNVIESSDLCSTQRPLLLTATFTPGGAGSCGGSFTVTREIELHRPPVMLIHGLWGSDATFGWALDLYENLDKACDAGDSLITYKLDYSEDNGNAKSFSTNLIQPRRGIASAVQKLRDQSVAATQADVIAHNMGGLLSRLYAADIDGSYLRGDDCNNDPCATDNNFAAGDIHKLITVDTPHFGSPWGCVLLLTETIRTPLGVIADAIFDCAKCGALWDMRPESDVFAESISHLIEPDHQLPEAPIPVAVMTGRGGSGFLDGCPNECTGAKLLIVAVKLAIWYYTGFLALDQPEKYFNWMFEQDDNAKHGQSAWFPDTIDWQWWVGPPDDVCENGGEIYPPCGGGFPTFKAAKLQCTPHYMDWGALGEVVHVSAPEIVPDSAYDVQVVAKGCDPAAAENFTTPLNVPTAVYGDVCGGSANPCLPVDDGDVNIADALAVLAKFSNESYAPIKARADLEPHDPDRIASVNDALQVLRGFQHFSYPFAGPELECPPLTPWGECTADIRADLDGDGDIDAIDDAMEDYETLFLSVNSDDDNGNEIADMDESPVIGEDDLAELQLCDPADPATAWWSISWVDPNPPTLQIWLHPDKSDGQGGTGTPLVNAAQNPLPVPASLWLESMRTFAELEVVLTLGDAAGATAHVAVLAEDTDKLKVASACSPSPCSGSRYWMTASDSRPASISGVEAIITATEAQMTPLCGESAGATTATASQIYVAAVNENAHGYPVFVQAGYVRARNEGDRQVFPAFSLEYKWGPTWDSGDSYRMAFRRCDITEPGTRKFEIYTCSTTPGCWIVRIEGLTHCDPESPTPDFVFTMWRPEFDGLLMDNARWYGELSNLEDRLCGSVANPCVFDQCKVRVNWGDTPVPAVIGQMGQECQTQRPEWGIAVPSPWKAEIWDLYPDQ